MNKLVKLLTVASLSTVVGMAGVSAADAAKGAKVFRKCKACHTLEVGKRRLGPNLAGIIGRKAGTVEKFRYSKAMAATDIVWDEANLSMFLQKPKKFIKGTKMAFAGLRKPADIENLLAYLKENGG
ncbi:MAG: cytochrome c family protein [Kordiimonadaceae bacterium]|nr:cytochrome c family protein [Kordiimonadaceae bacterium]